MNTYMYMLNNQATNFAVQNIDEKTIEEKDQNNQLNLWNKENQSDWKLAVQHAVVKANSSINFHTYKITNQNKV